MSSLDQSRFVHLWQRLGGRSNPAILFTALAAAYAEPHRAYHNTVHLQDCLTQFDSVRASANQPDQLEMALWFHDAIYNPHAADNEAQSAAWAIQALTQGGIALTLAEQVAEFILATQHQALPQEDGTKLGDAQLMVDVDLSILGRDPAIFDDYDRQIRLEYHWVPEKQFCERRAQLLTGFLCRPVIYQTEHFYNRYEAQAKQNLTRAIGRLTTC